MFLYPDDIDQRLNWPPGTALKMARRRRLPHILLPDGSIRFMWSEIEPLLVRVEISPLTAGSRPSRNGGPTHAA